MENRNEQLEGAKAILRLSRYITYLVLLTVGCSFILLFFVFHSFTKPFNPLNGASTQVPQANNLSELRGSGHITTQSPKSNPVNLGIGDQWSAPDSTQIPSGQLGKMIRYGKELVVHTSRYWGPKGSIAHISNGMNCQNCHLSAGTRTFGNNFSVFFKSYPKVSNRSGNLSPASQRIVECMERSLGGKSPDTTQKEVKAILAYMAWIGRDVPKGKKVLGSGSEKLPFLESAANLKSGKNIYQSQCQRCHGIEGQGILSTDGKEFTYPPVWGKNSFNDGAGMYRISNLAGFIKNNMPFGVSYQNPILTNEEAWNVAAYIVSQERPHYNQEKDWRILKNKPIDLPFGPYPDPFPEIQHKYGPFKPILAYQEKTLRNPKQ